MRQLPHDNSRTWQVSIYRGVSQAVNYALRALLVLAKSDRPLSSTVLAEQCDLPPRFLTRLLRLLVVHGVITSTPGKGGGYTLARTAGQITLLNIVESIEGPLRFEFDAKDFSPPARSTLSAVWQSIEAATRRELNIVTLAQLVATESSHQ